MAGRKHRLDFVSISGEPPGESKRRLRPRRRRRGTMAWDFETDSEYPKHEIGNQ